jgi:hypothetical protein
MGQIRQPVRAERPLEISLGVGALPSANAAVIAVVAAKPKELVLVRLRPAVVVEEPPACLLGAARNQQTDGADTR